MKIKNQVQRFLFILCVAFTVFSCDEDKEVIERLPTIVEIAKADPTNFSILVDALKKTGLEATLNNAGSYTVFAPTNAAFTELGLSSAVINGWSANIPAQKDLIDNLRLILQNHVIGIGTRADDLNASGYFKTFAYYKDIPAAVTGPTLSLFVNKAGNDFIINGGATNKGAKITKADINANNGVVHVIDKVLGLPTIVDHLVANPRLFSTLLAVVNSGVGGTYGDQSGVRSVLTGANNTSAASALTVFAPTNAAFTAATSTGGYLTGANATPENITKILQYHVSRINRTASSATSWTAATAPNVNVTITTLAPAATAGTFQTFTIERGTVKLYEIPALPTTVPASNITVANIQGTNGVIHAIDRVLRPVL